MTDWDEPMQRLDDLADRVLKASPLFATEVFEIRKLFAAIRTEAEQQEKEINALLEVMESIQGRKYAQAQEAINDGTDPF